MKTVFALLAASDEPFSFLHSIPGTEFLIIYAIWLVVLWLLVLLLRRRGFDSPITTAGGLVMFEGLGLLRMVAGSAHGMHKWGGLIIMMIVGALFFLLRAQNFNSGSGGSGGGCSGGSGCGGGGGSDSGGGGCGGGGGGCGGCGGS